MKTLRNTLLVLAGVAGLIALQARPALASPEGSFLRTLSVSGPVNLEITTGSGNIEVRTGTSNQVQVIGRISANWSLFGESGDVEERIKRIEANPPIQQSGNDIRIGHIDDPPHCATIFRSATR